MSDESKSEGPSWLNVTPEQIAYIDSTTIKPGDTPNFTLGGPMCCFLCGLDHACRGNPANCPPERKKYRPKRFGA
jgi:hypothetical protein